MIDIYNYNEFKRYDHKITFSIKRYFIEFMLKIVFKMSRDNFNKIKIVAKRIYKYFFVYIQIINQTIFIQSQTIQFSL